jgi:hypothetical protein
MAVSDGCSFIRLFHGVTWMIGDWSLAFSEHENYLTANASLHIFLMQTA